MGLSKEIKYVLIYLFCVGSCVPLILYIVQQKSHPFTHQYARVNTIAKPYRSADLHKEDTCDLHCQIQLQRRRRQTIEDQCEAFELGRPYENFAARLTPKYVRSLRLDHVIVLEKQQVLYCAIPKVGSSNWKRILLAMNGTINNVESVHRTKVHGLTKSTNKVLSEYPLNEKIFKLMFYNKFIFVRDPFERLLSAFRDKLEPESSVFRETWIPKMKKGGPYHNISFSEFLSYLSDSSQSFQSSLHEHWTEMYQLCDPCSIPYDFIGRMETIERDSEYVLKRLLSIDISSKIFYRNHSSHTTDSSEIDNILKYFSDVPGEILKKLYVRYFIDFRLFGYARPTYIPIW